MLWAWLTDAKCNGDRKAHTKKPVPVFLSRRAARLRGAAEAVPEDDWTVVDFLGKERLLDTRWDDGDGEPRIIR